MKVFRTLTCNFHSSCYFPLINLFLALSWNAQPSQGYKFWLKWRASFEPVLTSSLLALIPHHHFHFSVQLAKCETCLTKFSTKSVCWGEGGEAIQSDFNKEWKTNYFWKKDLNLLTVMAKSQTDFVNFRTKGNICNLSFSKHFLCLPLILKTFYFTAITIFVLVLEGTLVLPLLFFF